jgi:hypothetical protein
MWERKVRNIQLFARKLWSSSILEQSGVKCDIGAFSVSGFYVLVFDTS